MVYICHAGSAVKPKKKKKRQHNGAHGDADGNLSRPMPPTDTLTADDTASLPVTSVDNTPAPAVDVLSEGLSGLKIAGEDGVQGTHVAAVVDAKEQVDSGVSASSSGTPSPLPVEPSATTVAAE